MNDLRDCTILLVEDSSMNQRMVTAMLKKKRCRVVVANNGLEALEEFNSQSFDLILMDIQMPVMDGFEATQRIRGEERGSKRHTPIVAMTAYDTKEDEQECLKAGMDRYLSKPIDVNRLYSIVEEVISTGEGEEEEKREEKKTSLFGDRESMVQQMGGDEELVKEVVEVFTQDVTYVVKDMERALMIKDFQKIERLAHGLKGALGNMGAERGYELGKKLELVGRRGSLEDVRHQYGLLVDHIHSMLDYFSREEE